MQSVDRLAFLAASMNFEVFPEVYCADPLLYPGWTEAIPDGRTHRR